MTYTKKDTIYFFGESCPIDADGIGHRIGEMEGHAGGPKKLHQRTGISTSQLHRYQNGSLPKSDALVKMCLAGYCVEWILTGRGPMRYDDAQNGVQEAPAAYNAVDIEVMTKVSALIAEACITEQVALPLEVRAELAKGIYSIHQSVGTPLNEGVVGAFIKEYNK